MLNKNQIQKVKFFYYLRNTFLLLVPSIFSRTSLQSKLKKINQYNVKSIKARVDYYNQINEAFHLSENSVTSDELFFNQILKLKKRFINKKPVKKRTTYFFDLFNVFSFFPKEKKLDYKFGDITYTFPSPTVVKSRPIIHSKNSVILGLNKVRHFNFVKDPFEFMEKKDMAVWRGYAKNSKKREYFIKNYHDVPIFDIGQHAPNVNKPWSKGYMPISEQLKYKFIFCIEGADTATNIKWVMSSNSVCVMPQPKYETWFMEGKLKPNYHYICIKDDFSDAENKIKFFINHPNQTKKIITNANDFVKQFKDQKKEKLISLLVLEKYFSYARFQTRG